MSGHGFRFAVRVKPGARREAVGGRWRVPAQEGRGPSQEAGRHRGSALVVSVTAAAVEGKANEAVRRALAKAFGMRRQDVRLVSGERRRDKLIELDPAPADAAPRLAALLDSADSRTPDT